jgi:LAO/AO transport system kinase
MNRHADDEGVFIRSLATRGYLGGVSRSTGDVVSVMDAMGMDVVIIETVGVGQDEVDIVRMAHTTAVVMVPGLGDDIQAIKAGILEIGDVFVVNKADRADSDRTVRDLRTMLDMNVQRDGAWLPQVLKTEASRGNGIEELVNEFEAHRSYLFGSSAIENFLSEKCARTFMEMLKDRLFAEVFIPIKSDGRFKSILEDLVARRTDPYTVVESIVAEHLAVLTNP